MKHRFAHPAAAIALLERCRATVGVTTIRMRDPGLKCLAAIDYLCHYCGYSWSRV